MSTPQFATILSTLMAELVHGSPDPDARTYMLNQGDPGLLGSLDRVSADAASANHAGGASIAAHVEHLRYGLSLLNRWAAGEPAPWHGADWTVSWKKSAVSEPEWRTLRDELRREASMWTQALGAARDVGDAELGWIAGSVAHLAYHLGAIRQIDRAARGPTAEDEARVRKEHANS